ncbi:hypothetical protein BH10PSE4_BH10PSE4_46690 [soil metagenome]
MTGEEPRDHHYAPQFYLRNFAIDAERRKIATIAKNGSRVIWGERSIETLGYERDFYVHQTDGAPVSVETAINRRIETPISASETWRKIASGRADMLDRSDRSILYALVRHLKTRTPHALQTSLELAQMAAGPNSEIPFTDEERTMYAAIRAWPGGVKAFMNLAASNMLWSRENFESCALIVLRSPIPLRASTTPVLSVPAPPNPALSQPLPGMSAYVEILPLAPTTMLILALGDFGGAFSNTAMTLDEARHYNRQFIGQLRHFDPIRHVITGRDGLVEEMAWAGYETVAASEHKIVFRRLEPEAV